MKRLLIAQGERVDSICRDREIGVWFYVHVIPSDATWPNLEKVGRISYARG